MYTCGIEQAPGRCLWPYTQIYWWHLFMYTSVTWLCSQLFIAYCFYLPAMKLDCRPPADDINAIYIIWLLVRLIFLRCPKFAQFHKNVVDWINSCVYLIHRPLHSYIYMYMYLIIMQHIDTRVQCILNVAAQGKIHLIYKLSEMFAA